MISSYGTSKKGYESGFTLVEMLVVLALLGLIVAIPFISFQSSRNTIRLESGYATVLHALESARSRARSGVGTSQHGVHIESGWVTVFEGSSYTGDGDVFYLPPRITAVGVGTDVVFERISGEAGGDTSVTISDQWGDFENISVTTDGSIR